MKTQTLTIVRLAIALAALALNLSVIQKAQAATVNATYNSVSDVPVTAGSYTATGNTVSFTLNYAPVTGTELMVVKNTGLGFIAGTFDNLAQGQAVALSYNGTIYNFVANYYGGSGNDLVLVWANNRAFAWGNNDYGQLGDNSWTQRQLPVPVLASGVLEGKTVVAIAAGWSHSLALCSDGTVVAWGYNGYGQLGDPTTTQANVPVAVNTTSGVSALAGKTVVAIAAGFSHSLALCSDGTVAAWGDNTFGQLGDNTTTMRNVPAAVNTASGVSALYGKTVVAIAAGGDHSLALCSDGTVAAWGYNSNGQLGDNTTTQRYGPVAVNMTSGVSALYGKTVVALAAGIIHSLALCSDGTVTSWGYNSTGQLGDNTTTDRLIPVAVNTTAGVSALYGKTVVALAAGILHSLALCSDGMLAAWGDNANGQLGDYTTTQRNAPVAVTSTPLAAGGRFTRVSGGSRASHTLALVAVPPGTGYSQWQLAEFGVNAGNPAIAGELADPDHDGLSNLLEYATRSNPNAWNASPLTGPVPIAGPAMQVSFPYRAGATDLRYIVQRSANLSSWTEVYRYDLSTGQITEASNVTATENATTQVITVLDAGYSGAAVFWRVLAETVTVLPGTGFSQWQLAEFGVNAGNPAIAGELADPDHDGLSNLLEYASRSNPNAWNASPLTVPAPSAGPAMQVSFPYRAGATDVRYIVQRSANLSSWTEIYRYDLSTGQITEQSNITADENAATQVITVSDADYSGAAMFWRMIAEQP